MTFEFNSAAAAAADGAFMEQFYPYTTSPTATTSATAGPSASASTLPTTMAAQQNGQQPTVAWPVSFDYAGMASGLNQPPMHSPNDASASSPGDSPQSLSLSPGHLSPAASGSPPQQQILSPLQPSVGLSTQALLTEWSLQQHTQTRQRQVQQQQQQLQQQQQQQQSSAELQAYIQNPALMHFAPFATSFQQSAIEYLPAAPATTPSLEAGIQLEPATFTTMPPVTTAVNPATTQAMQWGLGMANWQDFDATMVMAPTHSIPQRLGSMTSLSSNSPTGTCIEVHSLGSSGEIDWSTVDLFPRMDSFPQAAGQQTQGVSIFNPGETLHLRTNSDSSQSDGNSLEFGSYEEVSFATPFSPFSQDSDSCLDAHGGHNHSHPHAHSHHQHSQHNHNHSQELVVSPAAVVGPMPIKAAAANTTTTVASTSTAVTSSRHSPSAGSGVGSTSSVASGSASSSSPPIRRSSGPRKSPISKPTKAVIRRTSTGKDGKGEKKVGRRRGPLLPEQRKQASEIRKLRACLRCKFLKKTCDKGEPCAGCQPSHARLWQVPCTRIDIKDVGLFMKDWKADYERHMDLGVSVFNVKGFAPKESLMWITHGYGFCLPVMVREVYVADESCFEIDWVESHLSEQEPIDFGIRTEHLDVGQEGISTEKLSAYLDRHIDGSFEYFIDDHFEGTPFITEVLKTAHRYYVRQGSPIIRKALKLVLAYNLTMHITMVEQQGSEVPMEGQIDDEDSKFYGKVVAPVMINFQIKCAMADMWRELQREILEELSSLYSSVYSGDRLKNWPTIFMLAAILLIVWEEMQFDCHYRVPDASMVDKFCNDMESTPVGVIVGLFHAISQKLPAFTDWDTSRHGQVLNNNEAVCDAMTEVRQHIMKHESYLRTRPTGTEFNRYDFDCLSNKFLSKLVIRAN